MRNKVCLTYIVSMAAFDQICCRRTVSVIASPERTQKEKMETQLYSFTRFLCLCSRELAIVLNYSWLLRCIAGNWVKVRPQNIPMVHCDTVLMAALETSMWLDITCNLQMAPWTHSFLKYPCQNTMSTPWTWPPKWHRFPVSTCSAL